MWKFFYVNFSVPKGKLTSSLKSHMMPFAFDGTLKKRGKYTLLIL